MSQYIPELDDPFDSLLMDDDDPIVTVAPSMPPNATIVATPSGDEIVRFSDLEEPTRIFNAVELAALVADSCPHRHPTVRSFHAVKPLE